MARREDPEHRAARERQKRLRERRHEAGLQPVSAWVPMDRARDARELLAALAEGRNEVLPSAVAEMRIELAEARAAAAAASERAVVAEAAAQSATLRAEAAERSLAAAEAQVGQAQAAVEADRARVAEADAEATSNRARAEAVEAEMADLMSLPVTGRLVRLTRWLSRRHRG